jgi:glyoxylase-like metal-dependent hydrolase (beta-lactamase superfamily II)/8-oxo-dGTP pyrophosphatase MutT (NUDIX family)
VTPPTDAAGVVLARGPGSAELYVVRRSPALRFFGGFFAFPGGKVAPADAVVLPADPRRAAAVRELFEETGVLLARHADGTFPRSGPDLDELRGELVADRLTFADVLAGLGLHVEPADLRPAGTLVTPAFVPMRFDTIFYTADLPPGQEPAVWPGELDQGRWTTAAGLLACWRRGECLVASPTLVMLEAMADRPVAELAELLQGPLASLAAGALPPIPCSPEVQLIPLRTVALAPSTHTNAYLVGRSPAYLIDPGAHEPDEQQRLFDRLDASLAAGVDLRSVVLTHHHPDHVGAAAACAARYRVPVWAHPETARRLSGKVAVERTLDEGDRLDLGRAPDDGGPWHLEAVFTPGHAPGHLAFHEPRYRLLFAGDMVSTLSSVVIGPPDGDLAVYLDSLRRLRTYNCRLLLPAHGSPTARPDKLLDDALAHRREREEQLVAALQAGPRRVADLGPDLYRGLPANLMRFAHMQILAGLHKLEREGRAQSAGEGDGRTWRLV